MAIIKDKRKGILAAIFATVTIGAIAVTVQTSDDTLRKIAILSILPAELAAGVALGKSLEDPNKPKPCTFMK